MKVAAILVATVLFLGALIAFPYAYDYRLAPLARLANQVRVGDPCASSG